MESGRSSGKVGGDQREKCDTFAKIEISFEIGLSIPPVWKKIGGSFFLKFGVRFFFFWGGPGRGGEGGERGRWPGHLTVGGDAFGGGAVSQGALGQLICPQARQSALQSFGFRKFIILQSEGARQILDPILLNWPSKLIDYAKTKPKRCTSMFSDRWRAVF